MLQIMKTNKLFGITVAIVELLLMFGTAHATIFEATLSRVYLNTSGGTGSTLDDDFSEDYYDYIEGLGGVVRIQDAFYPPVSEPPVPFYWFHEGGVENTSLPGSGLHVTLSENEKICLVTPGGANGPWGMNDTGESDFRVYFTNPTNVWEIGPDRWNNNYIHITRLPYEESTADEVGVHFNYTSGWHEGAYYELLARIFFSWKKDGLKYKSDPITITLDDTLDVLGIRLDMVPSDAPPWFLARGFYNLNGGSWQLLKTVEPDWWSENYLSVAYNVGVEHRIAPVTLSGWVWMDGSSDYGYSLDEGDLLYFFAPGPLWYYNISTGLWNPEGPMGWIYADWPFYYELDSGHMWFILPPESGLWVYHFSTNQWELLPRIIPVPDS